MQKIIFNIKILSSVPAPTPYKDNGNSSNVSSWLLAEEKTELGRLGLETIRRYESCKGPTISIDGHSLEHDMTYPREEHDPNWELIEVIIFNEMAENIEITPIGGRIKHVPGTAKYTRIYRTPPSGQ